ncbi:MAG: FecR domain-containing protein [Cytophagales bacterium]|nr:FecR domain-containing protein [Cytophagales bacterium]
MSPETAKDTLFLLLAGRASPLQWQMLEEWTKEADNRDLFYAWLEEWEGKYPQFVPDTEAALERLIHRVHQQPLPSAAVLPPARKPWRFYFGVAASLLLVLGCGAWLLRDRWLYRTYATSFGEVKQLKLADGSAVVLNANSSLRVPRFGFGAHTRQVFVQGEAEFSVVHTVDNQPFKVTTPDKLQIEVLGTEFVVMSRKSGSKVALRRGKVQLTWPRHPGALVVRPGHVVTLGKGLKEQVSVQNQPEIEKYSAWKEHRYVFERTPVAEIVQSLDDHFGVKVSVADSALLQRTLTGTFRAEKGDDLLQVILHSLQLSARPRADGTLELLPNP